MISSRRAGHGLMPELRPAPWTFGFAPIICRALLSVNARLDDSESLASAMGFTAPTAHIDHARCGEPFTEGWAFCLGQTLRTLECYSRVFLTRRAGEFTQDLNAAA